MGPLIWSAEQSFGEHMENVMRGVSHGKVTE